MVPYVIRRLTLMMFLLLVLSVVTFALFNAVPTDPARLTCGKTCTPEIVAANRVRLGLDKPITMQYLDGPPTEIGHHVGAALVGTMLGIFLSYGLVGPVGSKMEHNVRDITGLLKCVKAGLVSFAGGSPPAVALEFARKTIPSAFRPTSEELEEIIKEAKKK